MCEAKFCIKRAFVLQVIARPKRHHWVSCREKRNYQKQENWQQNTSLFHVNICSQSNTSLQLPLSLENLIIEILISEVLEIFVEVNLRTLDCSFSVAVILDTVSVAVFSGKTPVQTHTVVKACSHDAVAALAVSY